MENNREMRPIAAQSDEIYSALTEGNIDQTEATALLISLSLGEVVLPQDIKEALEKEQIPQLCLRKSIVVFCGKINDWQITAKVNPFELTAEKDGERIRHQKDVILTILGCASYNESARLLPKWEAWWNGNAMPQEIISLFLQIPSIEILELHKEWLGVE